MNNPLAMQMEVVNSLTRENVGCCHGTITMNPLLYKMLCCVFMATLVN
jgi:alpha-galactosidase/6-phospho-beta-glucosidase family protein